MDFFLNMVHLRLYSRVLSCVKSEKIEVYCIYFSLPSPESKYGWEIANSIELEFGSGSMSPFRYVINRGFTTPSPKSESPKSGGSRDAGSRVQGGGSSRQGELVNSKAVTVK